MLDVAIIGGGPAGLTAAVYCIRKRLDTLLISEDLGGKTRSHLELPFLESHQVISGVEIVERFKNQIEHLQFAHSLDKAERVEVVDQTFRVHTSKGKQYGTTTVIIGTGARGQRLQARGERKYMMRGLCYSAVSYAPMFIDRRTAVVGNSELALRSSAELANHAKHVFLVTRSSRQLESPLGRWLLQAENVTILEGYKVREIRGDEYARSMLLVRDGEQKEVAVEGIFVEKKLIPNSELVADLVNLDEEGRIKIDSQNRTSRRGIFAAGDVTNTYREQVLVAMGEGAKAALSAFEYLMLAERGDPEAGRP